MRISCRLCPAEMIIIAGDMKEFRKPWKSRIMPSENRPCMASSTPRISTSASATAESAAGIMPRIWLSRAKRTFCALTEA